MDVFPEEFFEREILSCMTPIAMVRVGCLNKKFNKLFRGAEVFRNYLSWEGGSKNMTEVESQGSLDFLLSRMNRATLKGLNLKLCTINLIRVHPFSYLNEIFLDTVGLYNEQMELLIVNCSMLQSLILINCQLLTRLVIKWENGINLRHLKLVKMSLNELTLSVPNLEVFSAIGRFNNVRFLVPMRNIKEGSLCGNNAQQFFDIFHFKHVSSNLVICHRLLEAALSFNREMGMDIPIRFQKLKNLEIRMKGVKREYHISAYKAFFQYTLFPALNTLSIDFNSDEAENDRIANQALVDADQINLQDGILGHLKHMQIDNFSATIPELRLLEFFLEVCPVLEVLNVVFSPFEFANPDDIRNLLKPNRWKSPQVDLLFNDVYWEEYGVRCVKK